MQVQLYIFNVIAFVLSPGASASLVLPATSVQSEPQYPLEPASIATAFTLLSEKEKLKELEKIITILNEEEEALVCSLIATKQRDRLNQEIKDTSHMYKDVNALMNLELSQYRDTQ